jgi:competence ComEA-like helix-hairpin-helix protein
MRMQRGIVLILSLLVLIILVVIIAQMSSESVQNMIVAENMVADLANSYALRSAYFHALLYLQHDADKGGRVDSLHEEWAKLRTLDLGGSQVDFIIEDQERKINLAYLIEQGEEAKKVNQAVADQFSRIMDLLGHEEKYARMILDYIDPDIEGEYEIGARNQLPLILEELLQIEGMIPEVLYGGEVNGQEVKGIVGFVTLIPPASEQTGQSEESEENEQEQVTRSEDKWQININTAPAEVLESLSPGLTPQIVQNIISYREAVDSEGKGMEFKSVQDLRNVQGISEELFEEIKDLFKVTSTHFLIRTKARAGKLEKNWAYLVRREGGQIKLLRSRRYYDHLRMHKPEQD